MAKSRTGRFGKIDPTISDVITVAAFALLVFLAGCRQELYEVGNSAGVRAPKLVFKVEPQYTGQARDAGIQGKVKLSFVVGRNGKPRDIRVIEGLERGLDKNAIAALEQWRFEPATKNGLPVEIRAVAEIVYKLP